MNAPKILTHINAFITLDTLLDNLISINFDLSNPLDADLNVQFVQVDSGVNGETFAHFDQAFDNFVVPAHGSANSGTFGNVLLTQGAIASLGIIPLGSLDVFAAQTVQISVGGYTVPWLKLTQLDVPTTYSLSLAAISAMQSLSSNKASTLPASLASSISEAVGSGSSTASKTSDIPVTSASKSTELTSSEKATTEEPQVCSLKKESTVASKSYIFTGNSS